MFALKIYSRPNVSLHLGRFILEHNRVSLSLPLQNRSYSQNCRTSLKLKIFTVYKSVCTPCLPSSRLVIARRFTHDRPSYSAHSGDASKSSLSPMGWFLLLIPVTTFCLGTWQVRRRQWKLDLMAQLHKKTTAPPIELPEDLTELRDLEYQSVRITGEFDHSREILLGPRSLLKAGDASSSGGLITKSGQSGVLVITPFQLADRDTRILVQRGWVPSNHKDPASRVAGQVQGQVELMGVIRLPEKRAPFVPQNKANSKYWYYRDVEGMAEATDCEPLFLDATAESTVPGGPVAGQTRVTLRNEHLSYIFTWYSLSAATAYMWYRTFIQKLPLK